MRRPEGPAGAVALGGGADEGPELVEVARTGRMVRPLGRPRRGAVHGRKDLNALPGGLPDDVVVVRPVQLGGRARLNRAPDEVDAEGPDPAVAHPGDLGGGRVLGRHHAVERPRGTRRLRLRRAGAEEQEGDQRPEGMTQPHGVPPRGSRRSGRRTRSRPASGRANLVNKPVWLNQIPPGRSRHEYQITPAIFIRLRFAASMLKLLSQVGRLALRGDGQRRRVASGGPADLGDPELGLLVPVLGHDLAGVRDRAQGVLRSGRVRVHRDRVEELLALGPVDAGQIAVERDPVPDPRGPEEPAEHDLRARVAALDAPR